MKPYLRVATILLFTNFCIAQNYQPISFEKKFQLVDIRVLSLDQADDDSSIKAANWQSYFDNATLYQNQQYYRIVPAQKTESPKVDYIDIRSNGNGFGTSASFSVEGPYLYINQCRSFLEKEPYQMEVEAEINSPSAPQDKRNKKVRILMKAKLNSEPETTASVVTKRKK